MLNILASIYKDTEAVFIQPKGVQIGVVQVLTAFVNLHKQEGKEAALMKGVKHVTNQTQPTSVESP